MLSTDKAASDYFNGHAERQAILAEGNYIQTLTSHTPHMANYNAHLHDAMTLRGLVDAGIHNAVQAQVESHALQEDAARRTEYDQKKTAYELGVKTLAAVTGAIPGAGPFAAPALGIVGQAIEGDVLGPAPTGMLLPTDHRLPTMSIGRADREILNAVLASGHPVTNIPPQYLIDGRIGSPDELFSRGIHVESGIYDETLSRGLAALYTQIYQDDPVRLVLPDRDMILRYNAVVDDPNPLKR
ncbi:hypothetical protein [Mycobacterium asiaticum]|uniref:Uncharacterized protein n=1 Tax=Mycobacterium asiaticum TaxID=1790 RepID=A0A1A3N2N0_MYCAS|nr:hypothetical protein [Mycobacterium asiaticum]OBK15309.1 hypothetical protein A5636_05815 [Mycobacterium asiaticum]